MDAAARIDAATEKGAHTALQAGRMKLGLYRQEQDLILETAQIAANTLTSLFGKSKGAAIASAVMNTGVAVARVLSASPAPYNFVHAGLVAAAGAAQIASMRSTTQTGGGAGASVGGGGGGDESRSSPGLQQTLIRLQRPTYRDLPLLCMILRQPCRLVGQATESEFTLRTAQSTRSPTTVGRTSSRLRLFQAIRF